MADSHVLPYLGGDERTRRSHVDANQNPLALKFPSQVLQQWSAPFRTVEPTAILVGRGSHGSQERTPHRVRTAESAGGSDLFKALVRTL